MEASFGTRKLRADFAAGIPMVGLRNRQFGLCKRQMDIYREIPIILSVENPVSRHFIKLLSKWKRLGSAVEVLFCTSLPPRSASK